MEKIPQIPKTELKSGEPKSELSPEDLEKILEKSIDIFGEEDLKFRDVHGDLFLLKHVLTNGFYGEVFTKVVGEDLSKLKENLFLHKKDVRESKNKRQDYNTGNITEGYNKNYQGNRGNVYYIESVFDLFKYSIENGLSKETKKVDFVDLKDKLNFYGPAVHSHDWKITDVGQTFIALFYSLVDKKISTDILNLISVEFDIDKNSFKKYEDLFNLCKENPKVKDYIINNIQKIRRLIIKDILSLNVYVPFDQRRFHKLFINANYCMTLGVIFDKNTKVQATFTNEDYPLQATLMDLKARPRNIVGIYLDVNVLKDRLSYKGDNILEAKLKDLTKQNKTSNGMDYTVWEYLIQLATESKLPIYNLKGDMLWPSRLSNEGIVKMKKSEIGDVSQD